MSKVIFVEGMKTYYRYSALQYVGWFLFWGLVYGSAIAILILVF